MSTAIDFRNQVADCIRMAEQAQTPAQKALLLDLAQAWVLLAEQASQVAPGQPFSEVSNLQLITADLDGAPGAQSPFGAHSGRS